MPKLRGEVQMVRPFGASVATPVKSERLLPTASLQVLFPEGLVGCPEWRRFVLEGTQSDLVRLLRCLDEPGIVLPVADVWAVCPHYRLALSDSDLECLEAGRDEELLVLAILTVRQRPLRITANLVGPLVISLRSGRGRQVVQADSQYSVRHPII